MQAHVPITVQCTSDLTDHIAAFLIGVEKYCSYFGCGNWYTEGNGTMPLMWYPEYDQPLGAPTGPVKYEGNVWTRSFAWLCYHTRNEHAETSFMIIVSLESIM